jgi:hypothetical protein
MVSATVQRSNRAGPFIAGLFRFERCLETGEIAARYLCHRDQREESIVKGLMGAAFVAGLLALAGPGTIDSAAAAQAKTQRAGTSDATHFSAHRHVRRYYRHSGYYRPHYRPYHRPYYYSRPVYYRPYPYYAPAPFIFGIGFGPVW